MRLLFIAIQKLLVASLTAYNVTYVRMFNNQIERLLAGEINDMALVNDKGDKVAILIEFISPATIEQLGNGVQLYDPLEIKVHIVHQFFDAQDDTQDQNLVILEIAEAVYDAFQEWMPADVPVGVMTRTNEEWDYDHDSVYHFVQSYKTNFVDNKKNRPENGTLSDPNAELFFATTHSLESSNEYYYNN